jgi:uncharacterized delta-60 repeat protein
MFKPVALAVQSDGSMIVGGSSFQFARITKYGTLDESFGQKGRVSDSDGGTVLASVLVQPDGKIVAAGTIYTGDGWDLAATRYNPDGSRDSSFGGGDGKVAINFRGFDVGWDLALQSDGKLVVVGKDDGEYGWQDDDFAVVRLNSDGTLDNSFDHDGKLSTGFGGDEWATAVAVQPDGKDATALVSARAEPADQPRFRTRRR